MKFKIITIIFLIFSEMIIAQIPPKMTNLIVGTYTKGSSEGIYSLKFNSQTGEITENSIAKKLKNPSFLAISKNGNFTYSVAEIDNVGAVFAFKNNKKTGELQQIAKQSTKGAYLCHIVIDKTGKWIVVSSYGGGNFSVLPILSNGSIGPVSQFVQHTGKGILPNQEGPHVHSATFSPDNKYVFIADLGIDKIMAYAFDAKTGRVTPANPEFVKVADGSGPRHFTFHPNKKLAYLINEMGSTVMAFDNKKNVLTQKQAVSTLPADFKGESNCADIHVSPDGKFLYGSNRVHDSIVIYAINQDNGNLTYLANEPCGGKKPRNFMIDPSGKFLLVANMESNNIVVFERNIETGLLTKTKIDYPISMPVCLKMVEE